MIAAVIPTLYHPPTLAPLLEVLYADGVEVIVIDTKDLPLGIYKWWNDGVRQARERGATEIAVLNDDITITPGTLPTLSKALRSDETLAIVSPNLGYVKWQMPENIDLTYTEGLWNDRETGRRAPHHGITPFCFMFDATLPLPEFDEMYHWFAGDNVFEQEVRALGYRAANVDGLFVHHAASYSGRKRWVEIEPLARQDAARWRARGQYKDADELARATKGVIPKIMHRVAIGAVPYNSDRWWDEFYDLHPGWIMLTHSDPERKEWPVTADYWARTRHPAQMADLLRLEALWRWGGIYVDWDFEPYRAFTPLLPLEAFAAWETKDLVLNGAIGARPRHPAIWQALNIALGRMDDPAYADKRIMDQTGPGAITAAFVGRDDVLLLPPESFYPYGAGGGPVSRRQERRDYREEKPWAFAAHHWDDSWEKPVGSTAIEKQRPPRSHPNQNFKRR